MLKQCRTAGAPRHGPPAAPQRGRTKGPGAARPWGAPAPRATPNRPAGRSAGAFAGVGRATAPPAGKAILRVAQRLARFGTGKKPYLEQKRNKANGKKPRWSSGLVLQSGQLTYNRVT
jgi:hypothetical protein